MTRTTQSFRAFGAWIALGSLVGAACGGASALLLWLLDVVTHFREHNEVIVYALPLAGLVIGLLYDRFGKSIQGGANLIIDSVHEDSPQIPVRMAPMVLFGTVLTHLFGGSAGREGTAVQMGGSLADLISHAFKLNPTLRRELLAAGVAGGFASVFGTPIAGLVFGLEVIILGRLSYDALLPALVAAVVGDMVTRGLGIVHTAYPTVAPLALSPLVLGKLVVFGVAVAVTAVVFVELVHSLKKHMERSVPRLALRMAIGGASVVLLWKVVGTSDYLGLGVPTIVRAFHDADLVPYAFALKLLFTAVTLSAGFLGGEVTPLFFVGAALGNIMARVLGLPLDMGAGLGLAAVFAACANTPLALSIMAIELCGVAMAPHVVIVAVVAFLLTGNRSIYTAQRLARQKDGGALFTRPIAIRDVGAGVASHAPTPTTPTADTMRAAVVEDLDGTIAR